MSTSKKMTFVRKAGATVLAVGAAGLLAFSAVGAASAATGHSNLGIRDIVVTPTAPAVNFATPGTEGTFSANAGDGTAAGVATYSAGDTWTGVYNVPEGLEFVQQPCPVYPPELAIVTCEYSNDNRTYTVVSTNVVEGHQDPTDYNTVTINIPVISTGAPIVGSPNAELIQAPGLTSEASSAVGIVVGEEPPAGPLVLGGFLAAAGLGAGAFVVSRRRKATA